MTEIDGVMLWWQTKFSERATPRKEEEENILNDLFNIIIIFDLH